MDDNFAIWITQAFFDGQSVGLEVDAFQAILDPYNKQLRINLSGEQVERLQKWEGLRRPIAMTTTIE